MRPHMANQSVQRLHGWASRVMAARCEPYAHHPAHRPSTGEPDARGCPTAPALHRCAGRQPARGRATDARLFYLAVELGWFPAAPAQYVEAWQFSRLIFNEKISIHFLDFVCLGRTHTYTMINHKLYKVSAI